jgi:hypothetical protein
VKEERRSQQKGRKRRILCLICLLIHSILVPEEVLSSLTKHYTCKRNIKIHYTRRKEKELFFRHSSKRIT